MSLLCGYRTRQSPAVCGQLFLWATVFVMASLERGHDINVGHHAALAMGVQHTLPAVLTGELDTYVPLLLCTAADSTRCGHSICTGGPSFGKAAQG